MSRDLHTGKTSDEQNEREEVDEFLKAIRKHGKRAEAAATFALIELRELGEDFEIAAGLDVASAIEEELIQKKRFMRYVTTAARVTAELEELGDDIVVAALEVQGKNASVLRNLIEHKLEVNGTVRDPSHFSHPGKRRFAPRPNRQK